MCHKENCEHNVNCFIFFVILLFSFLSCLLAFFCFMDIRKKQDEKDIDDYLENSIR